MKSSNSNKRIRSLINELGISQTEFCEKTGITKSALSNYLNGDRTPRQDQIDKIASTFELNPSWLMGYDVPMNTDEKLYKEMVFENYAHKDISQLMEYVKKYNELFKAAEGCTEDQIKIATETLKAFKKTNKEDK